MDPSGASGSFLESLLESLLLGNLLHVPASFGLPERAQDFSRSMHRRQYAMLAACKLQCIPFRHLSLSDHAIRRSNGQYIIDSRPLSSWQIKMLIQMIGMWSFYTTHIRSLEAHNILRGRRPYSLRGRQKQDNSPQPECNAIASAAFRNPACEKGRGIYQNNKQTAEACIMGFQDRRCKGRHRFGTQTSLPKLSNRVFGSMSCNAIFLLRLQPERQGRP